MAGIKPASPSDWQFVNNAGRQPMPDVIARHRFIEMPRIVALLPATGSTAGFGRGFDIVEELRPGVIREEVQPAREALLEFKIERVIRRVSPIWSDQFNPRVLRKWAQPLILNGASKLRTNLVDVDISSGHPMCEVRRIADLPYIRPEKLSLDTEIDVMRIGSCLIRVKEIRRQARAFSRRGGAKAGSDRLRLRLRYSVLQEQRGRQAVVG